MFFSVSSGFLRGVLPWIPCLFSVLHIVDSWTEMLASSKDAFKSLAVILVVSLPHWWVFIVLLVSFWLVAHFLVEYQQSQSFSICRRLIALLSTGGFCLWSNFVTLANNSWSNLISSESPFLRGMAHISVFFLCRAKFEGFLTFKVAVVHTSKLIILTRLHLCLNLTPISFLSSLTQGFTYFFHNHWVFFGCSQ